MSKKTHNHSKFLLTFFTEPHDSFSLVRVNGYILNRYITGSGNVAVMIYTEDSFNKSYSKNHPIEQSSILGGEHIIPVSNATA